MKVSNNFDLYEFIDPETYKHWGDSCIWFIDPKIIKVAQLIRDRFNKVVTVNNWHSGGQYHFSGFRPPECTTGAKLSQHRFGRAADFKIIGLPNYGADEIRDDIITNFQDYALAGLTTIEDAVFSPTWLHADVRQTKIATLFIVKP